MEKYLSYFERTINGTRVCLTEGNGGSNCRTCKLWSAEKGCSVHGIDCTEILTLDDMLTGAEIPHTFEPEWGGYHLCYPDSELDARVCSVILHRSSFGREAGLLEIMGLLTPDEEEHDSVCGWLTAEDVFDRIEKHWKEKNG